MSSQTKLIKDILSLYNTILENKEVDETAETLRSALGELGYSEKGSELTSGGSVNDKLTDIVTNILKQYKQSNPNVKIVISAGNDKFHQGLNYTSQHTQGNAIDLTLDPYNSTNASAFIRILDGTKKTVPGFDYIDEYTHPSKAATAGHYHLQFGGGATSDNNKSNSNNTSNTETQTTTSSKGNYSSSTSYSDAAAEDAALGKELGGKLLNAMGLKESKVYSSFGNKTKDRYGEIIIPNEHNKKIKSAVKGTVVDFKYLPDCKNTIAIEFEKNGKSNYLVYCGVSSPTVRKNQTVSDGTVLGTTESDVTVTVYDSDKIKYKLDSDEETKRNNNKNKEEDIEKYKDSIYKPSDNEYTKLIKYAVNKIKTGKDIDIVSGHFKEKPTDKKIRENIERIKGLLK